MSDWRYRLAQNRATMLAFVFFIVMFAIYSSNHPAGFSANVVQTAANKGVLLALVVGKPAGVFGLCALGLALRWVRRPLGARWSEIGAVSLLSGVGLAVSSFIAGVDGASDAVEAAVLAGSAVAALVGGGLLAWTDARRPAGRGEFG